MSEVTEFLVWRSALADTPQHLARLANRPSYAAVVARMTVHEAEALAILGHLLAGESGPPPEAAPAAARPGDPQAVFNALRRRLLELLARVDGRTLHATTRLPTGREVDPWRLAGDLADHDVRCLAELRAG